MARIDGWVAAGFEPVRAAFAANFDRFGEVGAAVSVYHRGAPVVDLWGGIADDDTGRAWESDTLQLVFSATKAATATCAHLLVQRGELDLDAPVARYWPEFAAEGKRDIPVRWLLSHRAGLPALDKPVPRAEAFRWDPMVAALAAQRPLWQPGTAHGYHARTYGWLVGEVIRRVSGRSPGRFFAEEVAGPLGLEFWIGLPERYGSRVSRLIQPPAVEPGDIDLTRLPDEVRDLVATFLDPTSVTRRAFGVTEPDLDFNDPDLHAAELPSSNGICTARALARLYAALIGPVDGIRILDADTVAAATAEQSAGVDQVLKIPSRFGTGYMLPIPDVLPLGGPGTFGHPGNGGALGYADPDAGIGFGYVMNRMSTPVADDPRAGHLVDAVRACL